nr:50S ribosome-binding GTPase [Schwartzia sp. (in: firmicutes)]
MKFCPFCGAKVVHEQAMFCAECGQVLRSSENTQGIARKTEAVKDAISKTADNVSSTVRQYFQSDSETVSQKLESVTITSPKINLFEGNSENNRQTSKIEKELAECRRYAEEGYQLAKGEYDKIKNTLRDEKQRLSSTNREQDEIARIQNAEILKQQDKEWDNLSVYVDGIQNDIEMLRENQKDFSIIIYGKTMAGKSTLMEILTHGNGQSIGKGKQRTTLDVRSYYWQGMKITDVPGDCAFGGAEDERLAMEAAKSADLILFLLTDDAPQADEAEHLAQLKKLGKPVLGIVNVKKAIDISEKKLAMRNLQKILTDTARIDSICEQFKDFAQKHQQDWSDIPFVYTHLRAAFQAQPERANDEEVYAASNFSQVEEFILEKVRRDGKFLRMKNFIDITAVPMQRVIHEIHKHSANAFWETVVYNDKLGQLYDWREKFLERSQKKMDRFYEELQSEIDRKIYAFAEYNYENENAGKDWENVVNGMDLPGRCQKILEGFAS